MKGRRRGLRGSAGRCVPVAIGLCLLLGGAASATAEAKDEAVECTRKSSPTAPKLGEPLASPVKFSIVNQEKVKPINLGGEDQTLEVEVSATPSLPATVTDDQISLYSPTRLARNTENASTAHVDRPTFTEPVISERGSRIDFTVCVGDESVDAGSYSGQVLVGGPEGVQTAGLTVTVNEKDCTLFVVGLIVALLGAVFLSYARGYKASLDKLPKSKTTKRGSTAWKKTWTDALLALWTFLSLAIATAAMLKIYAADPAWGAEPIGAVLALFGTMLSATGLASVAATLKSSN